MKKVQGKLSTSITGQGFSLQRGYLTGEMEEGGSLVWLNAHATHRIPTQNLRMRRIGVPVSRFEYLEEAETAPAPETLDKRAEINAAIKAANAERAKREGKARA